MNAWNSFLEDATQASTVNERKFQKVTERQSRLVQLTFYQLDKPEQQQYYQIFNENLYNAKKKTLQTVSLLKSWLNVDRA